jgi:hypothetical protein
MRTTRYALAILGLVVLTASSVALSAQNGQQNGQGYGQGRGRGDQYSQMTGTYDLDTNRSDNAQRAADMATRGLPPAQRDRAYQSLLTRLQPPTSLAIERQGNRVSISSSHGPRTSFDVDGRTHNELGPYGHQVTTRVEFIGTRLSVTTLGDRNSAFVVTFEPQNYGDVLFVTRRLDSDDLRAPVTIRSYYRRAAPDARWDVYRDDRGGYGGPPPPPPTPRPRAFYVPEGTRIMAVLDTQIDTRRARPGERFTMTVESPNEYRGARIDGTIARISQYSQGHNVDMAVDFDTIRLRDGQTADIDAILNTVRTPGGVTLRVNSAGNGTEGGRTDAAIQQGAIGAGIGAVIGAIAGGGKGAAIGAVIGGAGGAILAQDRDQYLDLPPGTQVTIVITAPYRQR